MSEILVNRKILRRENVAVIVVHRGDDNDARTGSDRVSPLDVEAGFERPANLIVVVEVEWLAAWHVNLRQRRRRREAEGRVEQREVGVECRAAERLDDDDRLAAAVEARIQERLHAVGRANGRRSVTVELCAGERAQLTREFRRGVGKPSQAFGNDNVRADLAAGESGMSQGQTRESTDDHLPHSHQSPLPEGISKNPLRDPRSARIVQFWNGCVKSGNSGPAMSGGREIGGLSFGL